MVGDVSQTILPKLAPRKDVIYLQFQVLRMLRRIIWINLQNAPLRDVEHQVSIIREEALVQSIVSFGSFLDDRFKMIYREMIALGSDIFFRIAFNTKDKLVVDLVEKRVP